MAPMFAPLRERNYRLWAAADVVSVAGTWMQVLGLNWLVLSATGSAATMGVVVMLQALPVLLLGSWGGALADRLPARPALIVFQSVRALLALALVMPIVVELDKAVQRFRSRHGTPADDLSVADALGGPPPVAPAV